MCSTSTIVTHGKLIISIKKSEYKNLVHSLKKSLIIITALVAKVSERGKKVVNPLVSSPHAASSFLAIANTLLFPFEAEDPGEVDRASDHGLEGRVGGAASRGGLGFPCSLPS